MNILTIKLRKEAGLPLFEFLIDGKSLETIITEIEKKKFSDDPAAGKKASYQPISDLYENKENYFLRSTKFGDFLNQEKGAALLLVCGGCSEWGCWNVFCTIEFSDDKVIWKDFGNGHRNWQYGLRFEFDKKAYLEEFAKLI